MYISQEEIAMLLWHLDNSLYKCQEDHVKSPAGTDGLLHQLTQVDS